jgi:hypothetical protein
VFIPNNYLSFAGFTLKWVLEVVAIWNSNESELCEFSQPVLLDFFAIYKFHNFRNFYYVGSSYLHKASSSLFYGNLQMITIYSQMKLSANV